MFVTAWVPMNSTKRTVWYLTGNWKPQGVNKDYLKFFGLQRKVAALCDHAGLRLGQQHGMVASTWQLRHGKVAFRNRKKWLSVSAAVTRHGTQAELEWTLVIQRTFVVEPRRKTFLTEHLPHLPVQYRSQPNNIPSAGRLNKKKYRTI